MANTKITTNVIADDAITTAKIADDAVGNDQLASGLTLGGNTAATLSTAAQPNITSVGTLSALTVSGDLTIADKIVHSGDTDTFFRFAGANDIRIVAGNVEHAAFDVNTIVFNQSGANMDFRVESTGNASMLHVDAGNDRVGIGTNAASETLHVNGAAKIDGNLYLATGSNTPYIVGGTVSTVFRNNANNASNITILDNGNTTFNGEVTFNDDIGLGMNGASFGTGVPTINFKGTSNANTRAGALLFKENNDDNVAALYVTDGSDAYGTVLAAYQGDIKFATGALNGFKMIVKSDGKVGIGTTSPGQKLTVAGAVESTSAQGNAAFYATTAGSYNQQNGSGGTAWAYGATGGSSSPASAASTAFGMHHWNGSAWSNPVNIDTNGHFLVGVNTNAGSASNTKRIRGGIFATYQGATAATHNTPTTMFSLPGGLGTYILSAGFDGIGNTNAYSSCAIVHGDGTSYKMTSITTSTSMSWDISGSNVRVQQSSGATLNVSWSMIRIQ